MKSRPLGWRLAPLTLALVLGLAACGQKGALYLPDKGASPVTVVPPDRSNEPRKQIH